MPQSVTLKTAGLSFELLAQRGLFWPHEETLFIADTHFGKEATFRRFGVPVPVGSTNATLNAIGRMLVQTDAKHLTILGDMFHAKSSLSRDVVTSLLKFFDEFSAVSFSLVRGNHDAHVGQLPTSWPLTVREPIVTIDRVALGHHPIPLPKFADLYLCGHIHPAVKLGSRRDSLGKLPCFWLREGCFVLPAIGDFTGTHQVDLNASDQAWVVANDEIHACQSVA